MEKILIVEDNRAMLDMLSNIISEKGYQVDTADDVSTALLKIRKFEFNLILSDLQLPDMDGISFFKKVKKTGIPFILITAFGSIELAVEAIKEGAFDFVSKPVDPDYLFLIIDKAIESTRILRENIFLKSILRSEMDDGIIVGNSKSLLREGEKLKQVAVTDTPVLLLGESGTGKELFARAIHNLSNRSDKPFIAVNSASIPENLLENELFGHEKGSYTDAYIRQIGKLEIAQGGTFFLDEIGDLPLNLQGKILRVIEEKKVSRLGSSHEIELEIRFIFATNINLEDAVNEKKFRKDLYYRINVFPITIPPLRDREGDVVLLAEYFIKKFSLEIGKDQLSLSQGAKERLKKYTWPGNVRELQNTIERALILCKNDVIEKHDIILPSEDLFKPDAISLSGDLKKVTSRAVGLVEKLKISEVLDETDFNRKKASDILNISYKTLLDKIKKYGIREKD
ncbi:MAG: sigma-54 dependent transcriptional regulator [Acidobacteriota bacterium]